MATSNSCFLMVCSIFCFILGVVGYALGTTLWVIWDAAIAGGGRGATELAKATEASAQAHNVKNFFNIPWQLLFPQDLQENKIGAPTEQENKEIIETKVMFNKLVQQVEQAPIPEGGTVVVWSDSFKSPVRERNSSSSNNNNSSTSTSDDPDVVGVLDSEANYYTSLNAGDDSHQKLVEKRKEAEQKEAEEKEKRRMGKVSETPSTMEFGSGLFHQFLDIGAGGYSSTVLSQQNREKRREYQQDIRYQKDAHKNDEVNEVVQNLLLDQDGKGEEYFSSSSNNNKENNKEEEHHYGKLMTKEEIEKEFKEREDEKYLQRARDDTDEEKRIESEVASMENQ